MRYATNDGEIDYDVAGPRTGIPVVFIHGFPFSKATWAPQVELLKKDFYVVTYDVRGHGASDTGSGQYTVEGFVDDLIGLLDHLKISRAVIVGLSMGGYIALRAVQRNPDRIRGLVLCDTKSEGDNNEGKLKRAVQVKSVRMFGMKMFTEPFLKTVFYEKTFQTSPGVVEMVRAIVQQTAPAAVMGTLIALAARTDTTASLYSINIPVLILVGQYDALTPPSAAHAMKVKIPGAHLHIISGAGHLSNLENPAEFNSHLSTFLKNIP